MSHAHVRHMSGVMCHVSGGTFHVSSVTCHLSPTPTSTAAATGTDPPPANSPTVRHKFSHPSKKSGSYVCNFNGSLFDQKSPVHVA